MTSSYPREPWTLSGIVHSNVKCKEGSLSPFSLLVTFSHLLSDSHIRPVSEEPLEMYIYLEKKNQDCEAHLIYIKCQRSVEQTDIEA